MENLGMNRFEGLRLLLCALVVCALTATTGSAATPAKVWKEQKQDFRLGYLVGFYDAANISRKLHPMDYLDTTFPRIEGADPYVMEAAMRNIYAQDEFADANVIKVLIAALKEIGKTHTVIDGAERFRRRWVEMKGGPESLARLEEAYRRKQAVAASTDGQVTAKPSPTERIVNTAADEAKRKKQKKEAAEPLTEEEKLRAQLKALRRQKSRERSKAWLDEARTILKEQGMLGPDEQ